MPDGLKKYQNKNKKYVKKDSDDDKPPKGAPPAAEEDTKEKTLQEAIRRIARAKKVFLKGKRIK